MLLFPSFGGFGVVPCIAFEAVIDLTVFYRAIAGLGIAIFRKSIYRAMMRKKLFCMTEGCPTANRTEGSTGLH